MGVTEHPTGAWVAQLMVEALGDAPREPRLAPDVVALSPFARWAGALELAARGQSGRAFVQPFTVPRSTHRK